MEFHYKMTKLFFLFILSLTSYSVLTVNINTYESNNVIQQDSHQISNKECTEIKQCSECSFEQLKTEGKCWKTGLIKIKKCDFYDTDNVLISEKVTVEDCELLYYRLNSIQKIVLVMIIVLVVSIIVRRQQKKQILGSYVNKYKIINSKIK